MATRFAQVVAEQAIAVTQVAVASAFNSAGQSITSTIATASVWLKNWGRQGFAIEYQIGTGAWTRLENLADVQLAIDLTVTTLKVRRVEFSPTPINIEVEMTPMIASDPTRIVISSTAPVNGDGRPDGTIYIQTA